MGSILSQFVWIGMSMVLGVRDRVRIRGRVIISIRLRYRPVHISHAPSALATHRP